MPKSRNAEGVDIDWYLVSIDKLKKIGVVVLLIALALGSYFYYYARSRNPRQQAERAIADAQETLDRLASSKDLNSFRTDYDRARTKIDEARSLFESDKYPEALSSAVESQTIAQAAISRQPGEKDADAQFLSVEGEVSYQKSGGDWKPAEARTPLFNGDWVKTGGNSSAELMFANGSLYTVGGNALLEIYSLVNPQTSKKQNTVKMQIGSIEVNTDDEVSTVRTPGTQVVVESKSTTQVGVDQQQQSQVVNLRGSASVTAPGAGGAVQLGSGEQVVASKEGALSPISKVLPPPALTAPSDNQVFAGQPDLKVTLQWNPQPGATGYRLQVSRSRLFASVEIDSRKAETSATARVTSEGSFYWRVASVDARGEAGPFSSFRRFRVSGGPRNPGQAQTDKIPPPLTLKKPFNIGGQYYMIEGSAEPGASVFVNDEEVDVDTSGVFKKFLALDKIGWNTITVKAVDAGGNVSIRRENVYVEE